MKLAQHLMVSLVAITVILVTPAVYGLFALRELRQVAYNLSTRDAVGALALGRLHTAFQELDNEQRIYLALGTQAEDRGAAAARVAEAAARIDTELENLREGEYGRATRAAEMAWARLQAGIAEEQRLVQDGTLEAADTHRELVVDPATRAMDGALDPIGQAIDLAGTSEVEHAQEVAQRAATTTFLALAAALLIALLIAAWTGRNLLRPVSELRRGMGRVAEGEFEETLRIPLDRVDEIGDLARSFTVMAQDLAALDRMKAEFVSIASHELKTPLSVIRGYVSLLKDEVYGSVTDEQKKVLGSVADQTDRLGRLIQQLLDISRFEAGVGRLDIRPVDLRHFLDDLAISFEALAAQNEIDFEVVIDEKLPESIEGDGDRLNEVVGNLLANAFKFTPRHGRIALRAAPARHDGEGIEVEVVDTGVGIPANQLKRIFEKFYQVQHEALPRSVGTGLGLAIAKEVAEAHGGTISVESEVRKGTTFRVFLPLRPPRTEATDHAPPLISSMKPKIALALTLAVLGGCAHAGLLGTGRQDRLALWGRAHDALATQDFRAAEAAFGRLANDHRETLEGRESLFYLGTIRLDPRNPAWDSQIAQDRLEDYLVYLGEGGPRLYRYPEALSLHEIARQLNLPPDVRVAGLQPEERVITIEERVVLPAEQSIELLAELEDLRQQVSDKDARIRQQEEELERIRRTLTGPGRP